MKGLFPKSTILLNAIKYAYLNTYVNILCLIKLPISDIHDAPLPNCLPISSYECTSVLEGKETLARGCTVLVTLGLDPAVVQG